MVWSPMHLRAKLFRVVASGARPMPAVLGNVTQFLVRMLVVPAAGGGQLIIVKGGQ